MSYDILTFVSPYFSSKMVYVTHSKIPNAGLGVFAAKNIKKGEVIEACPIIALSSFDVANLEQSILITYTFFYGEQKEKALLVLGYGSMYNHSYNPSAEYLIHESDEKVTFSAIRNIQKDEEITFDYKQGNPHNNKPLWFEVKSQ